MRLIYRSVALSWCAVLPLAGCSFEGVNSLPLPGAVGRGDDAVVYHVDFANVSTLESNSPVLISDVVVGSVGKMTLRDWHADVEIRVEPNVVVPANAIASIGQTSLLGSLHVSLDPPLGESPVGKLQPGATIDMAKSMTYPSTEQTLSSLSVVLNGGGLGQIGEVVHNFSTALNGREGDARQLLSRLDAFVGTLDGQSANLIGAITALNTLASTFAAESPALADALTKLPPALEVLNRQRPNLVSALEKLGRFSQLANRLVNETGDDLVTNLKNTEPALRNIADVGPQLDKLLGYATIFPYTQSFIDRGIRGDYYNLFATIDLTIPRLKRTLGLGTRFEQRGAKLTPAPGDPYFYNYTLDPMQAGATPPAPADAPAGSAPETPVAAEMPPITGPVLPFVPPAPMAGAPVPIPTGIGSLIFAGPYGSAEKKPAQTPPANTPGSGGR